ncbi:DUF2971 domain-containing protein [Aeromonas caviae]
MMDVDNDKEFFRYKYLPFGTDKKSLDVIKKGTMKFSCALEFNDPFDCQPVSKIIRDVKKSDIYRRLTPDYQLPPAKRLLVANRVANIIESTISSGIVQQEVLKKLGIASLSKTWNNILMWSHYAEFHKGFVVGFKYSNSETIDFTDPYNMYPLPIDYTEERYVERYNDKTSRSDAEKALLRKGKSWAYEEEERVLDVFRGPGIHKYNRELRLHCVIAGAKIESENLVLLKNAVKIASKELGRSIKFKQAVLSKEKFAIEIQKR